MNLLFNLHLHVNPTCERGVFIRTLLGHRSAAWPAGIMLKVTGGAMPGALRLWPVSVVAAAGDGESEAPAPVNRDDLSLYGGPRPESRYVEHEAGQLEEKVAAVRRTVEPYTAWCQGAYDRVKPRIRSAVRFGRDSYTYLKNPPNDFYPRAGVIGLTGVLGLFLARGSRIKRLLYPAGLVAASTALYYPEQAAAIARSGGDSVYDCAVQSYAAVEKLLHPPGEAGGGTGSEPKP
ncbi:MICOS complex subunit MIC26-like [Embiotoca jacksoni]|uniref:MICOS complex subunit MIC26-like n=1 Tax=Embiotoca jacksoni TaxID=100190 RepID=UPI0037044C41